MTDIKVEDAERLRRAVIKLALQFNSAATDEDLTPSQASVLGSIVGKGPINVSDLAEFEHLNPTMLSRVVGRLDERGLIARNQDPDDLRSVTLLPTAQGRRAHERIKSQRAQVITVAAAALTDRETGLLIHAMPAMEKLAAAMV